MYLLDIPKLLCTRIQILMSEYYSNRVQLECTEYNESYAKNDLGAVAYTGFGLFRIGWDEMGPRLLCVRRRNVYV